MLMRWSHDTRRNDDSIRDIMLDTLFHGNDRHDSRSASFEVNRTSSIENPAEDVFVVCNGHDSLDDEFACSCDFCTSITKIGVLPTNTSINLVHANCILHFNGLSLLVVNPTVKVLDDTKTVAT